MIVGVTDQGQGVPESLVPRLFTRFARADSSVGTGLGLSIARGLGQANGGDTFYEHDDAGVTFGVRLINAGPSRT